MQKLLWTRVTSGLSGYFIYIIKTFKFDQSYICLLHCHCQLYTAYNLQGYKSLVVNFVLFIFSYRLNHSAQCRYNLLCFLDLILAHGYIF